MTQIQKSIVLVVLLIGSLSANLPAQEIYWASKVDQYSSQFSLNRHSAKELLGVPNVAPDGRSSTYAWRVAPNLIMKESVEMAFVEVSFDSAVYAQQVAVFESFNPGAIAEIHIKTLSTTDNDRRYGREKWLRVYTDVAVIARSGYHLFDDVESLHNELEDTIASIKKRWWIPFVKDPRYQPQEGYRVLCQNFEKRELVKAVRVVINPLAVDGWNEIDAIGLSDSKTDISYPKVYPAEDIFRDRKRENLGLMLNTPYAEIAPVISNDGQTLYFSRTNDPYNSHKQTQDIWSSKRTIVERQIECNRRSERTYKEEIWDVGDHLEMPFNNILPNAIMGFSADGRYMFLNNNYYPVRETCDCDTVLKQDSHGLSYSLWDTTQWLKPDSSVIEQIEATAKFKTANHFMKPDSTMLACTEVDSANTNIFKQKIHILIHYPDSNWWKPVYAGSTDNLPLSYFPPEVLGDEKHHVYYNIDPKDSVITGAYHTGWREPERIFIDGFENKSNYVNFHITHNDKVMFLAIEGEDSYGDRDIYVSFKDASSQRWSKPQNLGPVINTISDESTPFYDNESHILYFSSAGHHGYGDRDIYMAGNKDDSWTNWTSPINLGPAVNTAGSDAGFVIEPHSRMAYLASTENVIGCQHSDIFSIQMLNPVTLIVEGTVREVNTKRPLDANVIFNSLMKNDSLGINKIETFSDGLSGYYKVKVTQMIENEKLKKFALFPQKTNYKHTDKDGNPLKYINLDYSDNIRRAVYVYQDLYMSGDDSMYMPPMVTDTTTGRNNRPINPMDPTEITEKDKNKTGTILEDPVIIVHPDESCGTIFYEGFLYTIYPLDEEWQRAQIQLLRPDFSTNFFYNEKNIDVNDDKFETFIAEINEVVKKLNPETHFIKIHIVSSASRVPRYPSNYELSKARAAIAKNAIMKILNTHHIPLDAFRFTEENRVDGPEYNNDPENIDRYKVYQYVKVWYLVCQKKKGKKKK